MERAPMLRASWNDLAGHVMRLMRLEPLLMRRLVCAPPVAFHCYAAHLRLISRSEAEMDAVLARRLYDTHPHDLVREVCPGAAKPLFQAMALLPLHALAAISYQRLDAIMQGPAREQVLGNTRLTEQCFGFFEMLAELDPLVMVAGKALDRSTNNARALDATLALLRASNLLGDEREVARTLRGLQPQSVGRFIIRRLSRIVVEAPSVPAGIPLRPVDSIAGLRLLGRRFRNCLAKNRDYWTGLLNGQTRFFEWQGEQPAVVALERAAAGHWSVKEIAGPSNKPTSAATNKAIIEAFRMMGIRVIAISVDRMMWQFDVSFDEFLGDEVLDGVAEEDLAA